MHGHCMNRIAGWMRKILFWVWQTRDFLLFKVDCSGGAREPEDAVPQGFRSCDVALSEDPLMEKLCALTGLRDKFVRRLEEGERCEVGLLGGELAHFSWLSRAKMHLPEIGFETRLPSKTAYVYHSYTFPAFRGKGVYAAVLRAIVRGLAQEGAEALFVVTENDNKAAQRAFSLAGLKPTGKVRARRRMGCWCYEPEDWYRMFSETIWGK